MQLIRKLCDRVSCGRKPFRVLMKQWIFAKFLWDRVYFWAIFYATGYRVLSGLPHTPVTSLFKYPPGVHPQLSKRSISQNLLKSLGAGVDFHLLRPRPHVSGYFWKRIFFYPFSKRFASTRGAFSKISPSTRRRCYIQTSLFELRQKKTDNQNALLLSPKIRAHALIRRKSMLWRQRFRKAPFSPVHTRTWKRRFSKRSTLESVFEKIRFWWPKTPSPCGR